jgi:hypothetical protein
MKEIAKMHITMHEGGSISVSGPLANKSLCYAMLEMARDAVKDQCDQLEREAKEKQRIISAAPADVLALNGRRAT